MLKTSFNPYTLQEYYLADTCIKWTLFIYWFCYLIITSNIILIIVITFYNVADMLTQLLIVTQSTNIQIESNVQQL